MNDGREYAEMLRTMASSCDVVVKPAKRARKKKDVKEEIVTKVNDEVAASEVKAADELPFKEEADGNDGKARREKRQIQIRYSLRRGHSRFRAGRGDTFDEYLLGKQRNEHFFQKGVFARAGYDRRPLV